MTAKKRVAMVIADVRAVLISPPITVMIFHPARAAPILSTYGSKSFPVVFIHSHAFPSFSDSSAPVPKSAQKSLS